MLKERRLSNRGASNRTLNPIFGCAFRNKIQKEARRTNTLLMNSFARSMHNGYGGIDRASKTFNSEVFSAQPESLGGNQGEGSLGRVEVDVDVRQVDSSSETDGSQGLPQSVSYIDIYIYVI